MMYVCSIPSVDGGTHKILVCFYSAVAADSGAVCPTGRRQPRMPIQHKGPLHAIDMRFVLGLFLVPNALALLFYLSLLARRFGES